MKSQLTKIGKPVLSKAIGFAVWLTIFCSFSACEEFVKIDPPTTQIIGSVVFESDDAALSAISGIYSKMMDAPSGSFVNYRITAYAGLSADEFKNYSNSAAQGPFYGNSLLATNANVAVLWSNAYQLIYMANVAIEDLAQSKGVTAATRQQLTGEAKFIRAFCHFYLTNLFGDVPYIKTTDYNANTLAVRTAQAQVYQEIIADLKDAQTLLSDTYVTDEKVRPNKATATALLARTYLYSQDWANASAQASAIINSGTYSLEGSPGSVFLKNSSEAIWQLMPVLPSFNTLEGNTFILTAASKNVAVTDSLRNAFEAGDGRKTSWINSITVSGITYYFPYKYKVKSSGTLTEYYMVLRLAEQYLIRAEAAAHLNDINQAVSDINVIRTRAGLTGLLNTITQAQCLTAIEKERRIEFLCEWGHRWFDLKRTGRADAVLGPIKPNWQSTSVLYPIPQAQLLNDQNMVQNPGY